ncbi:DUF6233 domain-containing protein [Streptomyces sp. NPDC002574]|uniref:DUF6233 domain-containing protein n=1 Tax=Streptomyces sp. NPDC002574 TaxID=3364652 RepID=UPI0036B94743
MCGEESLPVADGPLVRLTLPDAQTLFAVVRSRRQESDRTWAYQLEISLPSLADVRGVTVALPEPVTFWVPASSCTPIDGQDYGEVPTERAARTPAWVIERRPAPLSAAEYVVHRGDCSSGTGQRLPVDGDDARTTLQQEDAAACAVCRPDRVLLSGP